ncbi:major facilitator superfamily domain-containing protein [Umbelopsis sp. PMI_123]|nr:major facilitator superfamily domain-containing protein [Umbelopsis sp. PMI_123]
MAETQPLLQPLTAQPKVAWYRTRISQSPAKSYYVIPLCVALGMLTGMVQAPLVQFIVSLVCSREAKTLQDTFHAPNTAVTGSIFVLGRPREECDADATVQALSSRVLLIIQFCSALLSLCTTGFYSALSDKYGRRFVFMINASCFMLEAALNIFIARNAASLPIAILFLSAIIQGLGGAASTVLMCTHAYVADTTPPQKRNILFGRLIASLFSGMSVGPAIGAFIMEKFQNIIVVFTVAFTVFTTWLLIVIFILPESNNHIEKKQPLQPHAGTSTDITDQPVGSPKGGMLAAFSILFVSRGPNTSRLTLPALVIAHWLMMMQAMGIQVIIVLSTTYRFHWTPGNVGAFLSTANAARLVGLLVLLPLLSRFNKRLVKRRGERRKGQEMNTDQHISFDVWLVQFGLALDFIALLLQAVAKAGWTMYFAVIFQSSAVVYAAAIKSLFLHLVPPAQAGTVLGAAGMVEASAHLVGPIIMGTAYSAFVKTVPSMPFYIAAASLLTGFILVLTVRPEKQAVRDVHPDTTVVV